MRIFRVLGKLWAFFKRWLSLAWYYTLGPVYLWWYSHQCTDSLIPIEETNFLKIKRQVRCVRCLVLNVTYDSGNSLAAKKQARRTSKLENFLSSIGILDITVLSNLKKGYTRFSPQPPRPASVLAALRSLGQRTHADDMLVIYIRADGGTAPHPGRGTDEAGLFLEDDQGRIGEAGKLWLFEFFGVLDEALNPKTRVSILYDAGRSPGIPTFHLADHLNLPQREVVWITSSRPGLPLAVKQCSHFEQALFYAIKGLDNARAQLARKRKLSVDQTPSYSLAQVFNRMLHYNWRSMNGGLKFHCIWTAAVTADGFPWVLSEHGIQVVVEEEDSSELSTLIDSSPFEAPGMTRPFLSP